MTSFEIAWRRIETHAGEEFTQIRGGKFTYEVIGGHLAPDRTNQQIPKSHFEEAFALIPLESTLRFSIFVGHLISMLS
jgi:hypothetical protein